MPTAAQPNQHRLLRLALQRVKLRYQIERAHYLVTSDQVARLADLNDRIALYQAQPQENA